MQIIDLLLLGAPLLLLGLAYYLLARFRKQPLSLPVHYAFRITLVILLVWAVSLVTTVATGDGWSRLALVGWIFGVLPVMAASLVLTWAITRLAKPPANRAATSRFVAWTVVGVAALAVLSYGYRENALLATARNINADASALRSLSNSVFAKYDQGLLEAIAFNPSTPVDVLERLARHGEYGVRIKVCNNRETPAHVLEILSHDTVLYTKSCVAMHPLVSPELLARLAGDNDRGVRYRVAENSKTPQESLRRLARDSDTFVHKALVTNPVLPLDVLQEFSAADDETVRMFVARHPNATRNMRLQYATDPSRMVRQTLLDVGREDRELLTILSQDEDRQIRLSAQRRLKAYTDK